VDLDSDGLSDLISGSWPGELYFFRRQADGTFGAAEQLQDKSGKPINLGSASTAFAIDFTGDGTLDLVLGNLVGEVYLLPGEPTGPLVFGAAQRLAAGGEPINVAGGETAPVVADWDGDRLLDLVVGTGHGSVLWFRNAGTAREPKLEAARTLAGESPLGWGGDESRGKHDWGLRVKPCVVDWNGDGRLDLLLGDRCGSFLAKPTQTDAEKDEERQANDQLPQLRRIWAAAFAEFRQLQAAPTVDAVRLAAVRDRLARLKDEIARVQEIQQHFQPGYQAHGFVWLFLRKATP